MEFAKQALEQLAEEKKKRPSSQKARAVFDAVSETIEDFVRQNEEFAQAVVQKGKTLAECCEDIMKGVGQSISDLEVYRKAVGFYFPGAEIEMQMKINLSGQAESAENKGMGHATPEENNKAAIVLDLSDFF